MVRVKPNDAVCRGARPAALAGTPAAVSDIPTGDSRPGRVPLLLSPKTIE